jgi:uroporphyrin-III C-methyltransferase
VPLTHRGLATSVKFLTGHSREGGQEQLDESIDSGGWDSCNLRFQAQPMTRLEHSYACIVSCIIPKRPCFLPYTGVDAHTTLVIYMGLSTLPEVSRRLVASGLAADTPAVAVERGTLPSQRAVFAPLQVSQGCCWPAGMHLVWIAMPL